MTGKVGAAAGTIGGAAAIEHAIGQGGRFALRLPAGTASIRAVDGDVARVRDLSERPLAERFHITASEGVLELVARNRFGVAFQNGSLTFGSPAAELVIELPRTTRLAVDAASTDVSVTGIAGSGRFRTASGDLILQDVGGNIEYEGVSADVRIDAAASIEVVGRSISGDTTIRAPRLGRLEMTTTSGDIRLDADLGGHGPYAIRSISGDVTIVARGALAIEAQTVTGDLSSELQAKIESGPGRKSLTIGRGATPIAFKSVSGDLRVVEARDAATPIPQAAPGARTAPEAGPAPMPSFAAEPPAREPGPGLETARLEILRSLERGEIDVDAAMEQLAAVEEA